MKNEFKGTPGPWICVVYGNQAAIQSKSFPSTEDILVGYRDEISKETLIANGVLAAAAPELLELAILYIKDLQAHVPDTDGAQMRITQIEAVVEKALNISSAYTV